MTLATTDAANLVTLDAVWAVWGLAEGVNNTTWRAKTAGMGYNSLSKTYFYSGDKNLRNDWAMNAVSLSQTFK